jgi:hypothetical protein
MPSCFDEEKLNELLRVTPEGYLFHRESQEFECKEQFNFAGLADYFRDFAAFGNNRGGYLVFGIKDRPRRELLGLSANSLDQFEKIDPETISGFLLDIFSSDIRWEMCVHKIGEKSFGIIYVYPSEIKPIIAKKDEGRDQTIKDGEIYYRYGGRTQKIKFAELQSIINNRVEINNRQWQETVNRIGKAGPENIATFDLKKGTVSKNNKTLLVDEELLKKVQWLREGHFDDKGEKALRLIGDVQAANAIEVVRHEKQNLLRDYPYSATQVATEIKRRMRKCKQNWVWDIITENNLKNNPDYGHPIFTTPESYDAWKKGGPIPNGVAIRYKESAITFIERIARDRIAELEGM